MIQSCRKPAILPDHPPGHTHENAASRRTRCCCRFRLCLAAEPLPRSSPESQGVSSAAVLAFVEAADKNIESMNSFMLVRHGHVVAEGWWAPYRAEAPHSLYSLSKSFTSTAVGSGRRRRKLSVDDEVLKFFPEDAPKDRART